MLCSLSIRDFVIVAELDLEFTSGFTVLSGETGAGKSILLDALSLTLGERADAKVVREGAIRADLTAEFSLTDAAGQAVRLWLADQDLPAEEDRLLLRRTVDTGGRSKGFINGIPANLAQLRTLGEMLVDIHGQHAHQLLLKSGAQRDLLDRHAGLQEQAANVAHHYQEWKAWHVRIAEAEQQSHTRQLERERLEWQVNELDRLAPQPGEWEDIQQEHTRLSHAASLIEGAQMALDGLSEAEGAALGQCTAILHRLEQLLDVDPALRDAVDTLTPAIVHLEETVHALSRYTQRLELDPQRLAEVDTRLQALHSMARKYRVAPEQLSAEHATHRAALAALESTQDLAAARQQEAASLVRFKQAAHRLSQARQQAAGLLAQEITAAMQTLSMAGGRFDVQLLPLDEPTAHGLEQIEFLVAGHAGVAPRALAKVASGGELARISLAISVIASRASLTPTLIFDEVDSGIGGAVAETVGTLLRRLGAERQVLCVTHLPQVAAQGHQHFQVSKRLVDGHTLSHIALLDPSGRIEEVARMLGGADLTATTRQHAQEMLAHAS